MSTRYALLCLAIAAVHANAADAPLTGQPSAVPADSAGKLSSTVSLKPHVGTRLAAPLISETTAVRAPDGSLQLNCTERPNPKAKALNAKINGANAKAPQP